MLQRDRVIFQPQLSFWPKVVPLYYVSQDIVSLSLYPKPQMPGDKTLGCDLPIATFWQSDSRFVLPEGPKRGHPYFYNVLVC